MSEWLKRAVLPPSKPGEPSMIAQALHIPPARGGLVALVATSFRAPATEPGVEGIQVLLQWGPAVRAAAPWAPEAIEDNYREWWMAAHGQDAVTGDAELAVAEEHVAAVFDKEGPGTWPTTDEILDAVSAVSPLGTYVQAPPFVSKGWGTKTDPPEPAQVMAMELRGIIVKSPLGIGEHRRIHT